MYLAALIINIIVGSIIAIKHLFYHIEAWQSLTSSGIGNLYLIIMTILSFWIFIPTYIASFCGAIFIQKDYKLGKLILYSIYGTIIGVILPGLVMMAWFALATIIYSLIHS